MRVFLRPLDLRQGSWAVHYRSPQMAADPKGPLTREDTGDDVEVIEPDYRARGPDYRALEADFRTSTALEAAS